MKSLFRVLIDCLFLEIIYSSTNTFLRFKLQFRTERRKAADSVFVACSEENCYLTGTDYA